MSMGSSRKSFVYTARAVLPGMIERGSGYLLQMDSAAGLLSQIRDAAYLAVKHGAVRSAEAVLKCISQESFLTLPPTNAAWFIKLISSDYGKWLAVMQDLRGRALDQVGTKRLSEMHSIA